jgi:NAD(P)-dependent dehydrogenase (short-subunit alcohol dehydrogenase family)
MKVVIAGGTSGIGLATAAMMIEKGAEVLITGRDTAKLEQALKTLNHRAKGQSVDARRADEVKSFLAGAGTIDHLVLALSDGKGGGPFKDLDLEELRQGFENKLFPQLQTLQAALPSLSPGGSVTFVTSVSGCIANPGTSGYAAVNGALNRMTPILARELQPVRVNAVAPGVIDTPWWSFLPEDARKQAFGEYAGKTPAGRVGQPQDVARLIVQLIGNSFITGQVIMVDGGLGLTH